jgi:prepilin-type N-terminal cleavage/methylation domain-containing protein
MDHSIALKEFNQMKVNSRKGFTLIELLIVVVIIGILAAIAIPKFANTKEKAYVASMKSDLRNLSTAEESYFADNQTYTTTQSAMNYNTSPSVTVTVSAASGTGWAANASHSATTKTCAVQYGTTTTGDGVIVCQ